MLAAVLSILTLTAAGAWTKLRGLNLSQTLVVVLLCGFCMASKYQSAFSYAWYLFVALVLLLVLLKQPQPHWWSTTAVALTIATGVLLAHGERHALWGYQPTLPAIATYSIIAIAGVRGLLRRTDLSESAAFVAALVATLYDVRLAPMLAITGAPLLFARERREAVR